MAKVIETTKTTHPVFYDLEQYKLFCRDYGYRFDEADLYSQKSYIYRQYLKLKTGKEFRNQWEIDYVKWKESIK